MSFRITNLTCNHMKEPIGVDDLPHFSFSLEGSPEDTKQTAYRILVKTAKETVWDTGKVQSEDRILIPYAGKAEPETRYFWKVTVWNQKDETAESDETFFESGRMKPFYWEAKWITSDPQAIFIGNKWCSNTTAPYMRKAFELKETPVDATLYICGLGYYECYINGESVKDTVLDPAFTEYDITSMYKAHKIGNLSKGKNAIAVVLGDGFYNADTDDKWDFVNARWRDHSKCIIVLKITYKDGTVEKILSDGSFKGANGPITANDVRSTEQYDARKELGDWTSALYDDSSWNPVTITKAPGGNLQGQYTTPIKVVAEYAPQSIKKVDANNWLVDVGFNTVGWAEFSMTAPEGTKVMLRYGEDFDENLNMTRLLYGCLKDNEKDTFQTDYYTAKGSGVETWHPIFKYHGFRYILVRCETGIPADFTLKIQEVRTAFDVAGDFTCSDEIANKLQEIVCRSTRTNFHNMPTDCPHREKNGWTGDAQLSAEQLLFNFNGAAAYTRWLDDVARAQRQTGQLPGIVPSTGWGYNWGSGPAWDTVCAYIPYAMYVYCGDKRILKRMYPTIVKYIAFVDTMATDNIVAFGLSDWCPPAKEHIACELAVTDTAIYYSDIVIAARIARIFGWKEDAEYFETKAAEVRASFRKYFIKKADTELVLDHCTRCQTSLGCMLYYGLVDDSEKELFLNELIKTIHEKDDHFDVGILGAKYVPNVLLRYGQAELMVKAALNPTYPSWGDMVLKGATTLWEDWEGSYSQNHHMYGDISGCFYKGIAGIIPTEEKPGFRKTLFAPQFISTMDKASAWHMTPYGKVASSWQREGDEVKISVTVPVDCEGTLVLPNGMKFKCCGKTSTELSGGTHEFVAVKA